MNMNSRFSKKIHKHAKKNKKLTKSISSFIQEQEMNVQFDINKNIYNSFMTIYQKDDKEKNQKFRFIRHFYYSNENQENEEDNEDEDEDDEEKSLEEDDNKNKNKNKNKDKNKLEIQIDLKQLLTGNFSIQNEKDSDDDSDDDGGQVELVLEGSGGNNDIEKDKDTKKTSKHIKNWISEVKENIKNKKGKKTKQKDKMKDIFQQFKSKMNLFQSKLKKNKKKYYIDFCQDVTCYYHIEDSKLEFADEINYENHKLKYYEGDDLDENSFEDEFTRHCEQIHSKEKVPIYLSDDYFNHEFSMLNIFDIKNQNNIEKFGTYCKNLWLSNGNMSVFDSFLNYIMNRMIIMDNYIKREGEVSKDEIIDYMNYPIHKELDIDLDCKYFTGRLDLLFGIENKLDKLSFHECGVFLKILLQLFLILDRTSNHHAQNQQENEETQSLKEYENELRFCSIHKNEKGEFEEIVSKFKDSITLFFYKYKNHPEFQTIFQKSNITMESLVFGFKIKLFNEYMSEYIHKMFYDKKNKSQQTSFVTFYDECISDYKTILSFENKKQKSLLISKDIQTILFKWNEYSNISHLYKLMMKDILCIY
jgi:hypothetical protein